jgi:hypothetical protein
VTPHPDVASGRYVQAEFAADLGQVARGEGEDEYRDPTEFFRRTFLTDGLKHVLARALQRLNGIGGDPVVDLQTNFGGGKTHSMLALYHLFSGAAAGELPGIEPVLESAGVGKTTKARRAVLVGTALSPGQPHKKPDGTEIRTLWGELAWQLLGKEGFRLVAEDDRQGTNPGDTLRAVLQQAAPCLILIDEWVAYARQLYEKQDLPGGSFAAHLSFAQALTDAAKSVSTALVVASLPASNIEIGGTAGHEALTQLKNVVARTESPWRPASAEESFEIVRRRLFQPITDPALFAARDAVAHAFSEFYRNQRQEFPSHCREAEYERRIKAAYPIHPELFDRLYNDWSSLDKFQRTRGVLRLMAAVIHTLWERQDASLLILPAMVPIDEPRVHDELRRYLEDPWVPVLEAEVDGPNALPLRLDRENPNLGRYSATRRVARTIYFGSAPTLHSANRGVEDVHIKLGCAQPGESVATFGDALRRLTEPARHLYVDGRRYWYSTQPSVTGLAQDRAAQQSADVVTEEIKRRLREDAHARGDFARVHACPASSGEVPDEPEARLVILGPDDPHAAKQDGSAARLKAAEILDQRGTSPRSCRNSLVFLAADRTRHSELEQAVRQYLAWKSIDDDAQTLNLDAFQANLAQARREQSDETIQQRIPETYCWLLVPGQDKSGPVEWREIRLQGQDPLAVRAAKKLKNDALLYTQWAGTLLRLELDRIPLWRGHYVAVKQLAEDFAKYLYLPRLRDTDVLLAAIRDGVSQITWQQDTFAYADTWDEHASRYRGLRAGHLGNVSLEGESVLVKPEVAARQLAEDRAAAESGATGTGSDQTASDAGAGAVGNGERAERVTEATPKARRFHGTVDLNPGRVGRDAGQIAEAVVQHLAGLVGSKVQVSLEIHAEVPAGAPDHVVRTVTENCNTLKFRDHGFEDE